MLKFTVLSENVEATQKVPVSHQTFSKIQMRYAIIFVTLYDFSRHDRVIEITVRIVSMTDSDIEKHIPL